jgi:hypothetical protein
MEALRRIEFYLKSPRSLIAKKNSFFQNFIGSPFQVLLKISAHLFSGLAKSKCKEAHKNVSEKLEEVKRLNINTS